MFQSVERTRPQSRFHFTVRTLLVAMLVVALVLGYYGSELRRYVLVRTACAHIHAAGGRVEVVRGGLGFPESIPKGDPPRFGDVIVWVCFLENDENGVQRIAFTDEDSARIAPHLRGLDNTFALTIHSRLVSDRTIENLTDVPKLHWLVLCNAPVTSEGLAHLEAFQSLDKVDLIDCPTISDDDVNRMRVRLPHVQFDVLRGGIPQYSPIAPRPRPTASLPR